MAGRIAPKRGAKVSGGGRGRNAQVRVKPVSSLPGRRKAISSRQRRYQEAMAKVRAKGKRAGWHSIAEFRSASGAAVVKREMIAGTRLIDGKLSDWEIETRRLHDDSVTVVGSELFVKLK